METEDRGQRSITSRIEAVGKRPVNRLNFDAVGIVGQRQSIRCLNKNHPSEFIQFSDGLQNAWARSRRLSNKLPASKPTKFRRFMGTPKIHS